MSNSAYIITWADSNYYYIDASRQMFAAYLEEDDAFQYLKDHPECSFIEFPLQTAMDDTKLTKMLAAEGFKGGIINDKLCSFKKEWIQSPTAEFATNYLLHYQQSVMGQSLFYQSPYYFFAQVNEEGFLIMASKSNAILCFDSIQNIESNLAKKLFQMKYELIQSYPQEIHSYIINPCTKYQYGVAQKSA